MKFYAVHYHTGGRCWEEDVVVIVQAKDEKSARTIADKHADTWERAIVSIEEIKLEDDGFLYRVEHHWEY